MTDIKISDAARAYAKKAVERLGAYHVDEAGRLPLNSIAAQNYLYDAFKEALDATRAEARREASVDAKQIRDATIIEIADFVEVSNKYYARYFIAGLIRALATQPAPEPSEPMRSAEEWSALADESPMIVLDGERFLSFIRAIQTNAASAAEPLLEEAMTVLKSLHENAFRQLGFYQESPLAKKVKDVLAKWVKA